MRANEKVEIAIVGAGIAGIATAYYLSQKFGFRSISLIDHRPAMSYTSAQSGDNYRNWWPHPTMTEFTNRSIDLMQDIAQATDNRIMMMRRGYVLATRRHQIDELISDLERGYQDSSLIRIQESDNAQSYIESLGESYSSNTVGVDILKNKELIAENFPSLSQEIRNIIHVRRAGDISGQQLGQFMLETLSAKNHSSDIFRRVNGRVVGIEHANEYRIHLDEEGATKTLCADILINAAGPFATHIAGMLGAELPIKNIFQQKIAFEDRLTVVPRDTPYCVDLDSKVLAWTDEQRQSLTEDEQLAWLAKEIPGGVHCRPDGGVRGK